jgi:autotransporter adhesin
MSKKNLLSSGSRFALAFCAGFALTGVKVASAQTVAGNTGCLFPSPVVINANTVTGASTVSQGILYQTGLDAAGQPLYYCNGSSYALTNSVQSAIDSLKTQIAGLGGTTGGLAAVSTDASLAGAGTTANPLRVSAATQNAISAAQTTADAAQTTAAAAQSTATTAQGAATAAQNTTNQLGQTAARNLGGGVAYNPTTGALSQPIFTVGGAAYNNVGSALGAVDSNLSTLNNAVGGLATGGGVKYFRANSTGADSQAAGAGSVAIGGGALASLAGSVALGEGSTAAGVHSPSAVFSIVSGASPTSVVSVGSSGAERQIQNVAAGNVSKPSTDAVNGSQLFGVVQGVNTLGGSTANSIGAGATYDQATGRVSGVSLYVAGGAQSSLGDAINALDGAAKTAHSGLAAALGGGASVAADGSVVAPQYTVGGQVFSDAGSALKATNTRTDRIAASAAAAIGGGATYNPATGQMTAPTISVGGAVYTDAASAISAQGKLGVQYVPDAKGNPTATVNLVTASLPANSSGVTMTGLAQGAVSATSTDAVTGAQLHSTNQAIANLGTAAVKYDATAPGAQASMTLASPNGTGPVALHNVAAGVAASDAATVGQINQMGAAIDSRLAQDEKEISKAKTLARGAGAIAMATASLRYDDRVGRGSVGFGLGNYSGATALAAGLNYNVTQALRVNANTAYVPNTRNVGFGLGATYTFW